MIKRVIDEGTEFGARAARRLREEIVVWMTTVTPASVPMPRPVWLLWDGGDSVLMYSEPKTRIRNIEANPRVSLNFDGDGDGGDVIFLSGTAEIDREAPPGHEHAEYLAKYDAHIERLGMPRSRSPRRTACRCGSGSRASAGTDRPHPPGVMLLHPATGEPVPSWLPRRSTRFA